MSKVQINLGVRVQAEDKIKDLARDLAALAKLPGVPAADAARIKDYAQSVRSVRNEYQSANGAAFSLFEKTKGIATSALGGAGLGRFAALAGTAGVTGAVAAAAGIVAQLARMQYTFLETTTRGAATLSIGSDNFRRNLQSIQSSSFAGVPYGIGQNQMASALMTYGSATGSLPDSAFAGSLARYSRGSGIDVNSLAGGIGSIAQFGGDPKKIIRDAFDEAMTAGAFGRRFLEFTQAIAGLTQTLIIQNPGMSGSAAAEMATRAIGNLASMGGAYATSAGNAAGMSALSALGGTNGNAQLTALGIMAGVDPQRLMMGNLHPEEEAAIARQAHNVLGNNPLMTAAFASTFGSSLGPDVYDLIMRGGSLPNLGRAPKKSFNANGAAAMVNATDYGTISSDIAGIVSPLQATAGQSALTNVVIPALNTVKNIADAFVKDPQGMERDAAAAAISLLAVQVAGNAGIIGNLAKLVTMGGGTPWISAAAGAVARFAGGVVAPVTAMLSLTGDSGTAAKSKYARYRADDIKAAQKYGIDPALLMAVESKESDFGNTLTPWGTGDGGRGHGNFQLDPSSGASPETLKRVQTDHLFAAMIAAKMISDNLRQHGGNLTGALDEYNGPDAEKHRYAQDVESRYVSLGGKRYRMDVKLTVVGTDRASVHHGKDTTIKRKAS